MDEIARFPMNELELAVLYVGGGHDADAAWQVAPASRTPRVTSKCAKSGPMSVLDLLGHHVLLPVVRFGSPGAFLAVDSDSTDERDPVVLLVGTELPEGLKVGDSVRVYIHLDSQGRPMATIREAKLELHQVAFLTITEVNEIGAFADWGLAKELLVPFKEQTRELKPGDQHPIALYIDSSGRMAGTMRIREMLGVLPHNYELDAWVGGEAWRNEPDVGLFVILDKTQVGLVPAHEPHRLRRGEQAKFRISHVHADGHVELSLRAHAHEAINGDAEAIYQKLHADKTLQVSDKSPPAHLEAHFALSKKAFKRAVGKLLREGRIRIERDGTVRAI